MRQETKAKNSVKNSVKKSKSGKSSIGGKSSKSSFSGKSSFGSFSSKSSKSGINGVNSIRNGAKNSSRAKRREWMGNVGLVACFIGLLLRIPLSRMMGDKGIGFFAGAMELFTVISVVFTYGFSRALAVQMKYRARRDMYKSAGRVYRNVMIITIAAGGLLAAGMLVFSEQTAGILLLEPRAYLAVTAAAPAVLLAAVMGVMRGYFQGMGTMVPTVHSRLVEKIIQFGASLLLCSAFYAYGEKVAALRKTPEFAPAYGAMGAALGLTVACGFGILHMVLMRMVYAKTFKQQLERDSSKYAESGAQIFLVFFQTALPYLLCALLYNMNYLIDQRIFNYAMNRKEKGSIRVAHWGIYYGKYTAVIGIAAVVCAFLAASGVPKIVQLQEKQEGREAQFRFGNLMHFLAILTIPCAVWLAVLAEPLVGVLFTGDQKTAVSLIRTGSAVVVLFPFAHLFMNILQRTRKQRTVIFGGLAAFLLHLAALLLFVTVTDMGIHAAACGTMVFWLTVCVAGFIGVSGYLRYSPDWIRFFAIPAAAACVAGLLALLICRLLLGVAGNAVTLLVCLLVCLAVYNGLLFLFKAVKEEELREMPGGGFLLRLWERTHMV